MAETNKGKGAPVTTGLPTLSFQKSLDAQKTPAISLSTARPSIPMVGGGFLVQPNISASSITMPDKKKVVPDLVIEEKKDLKLVQKKPDTSWIQKLTQIPEKIVNSVKDFLPPLRNEPLVQKVTGDKPNTNIFKAVVDDPNDVTHPDFQKKHPVPKGHTRLYRGENFEDGTVVNQRYSNQVKRAASGRYWAVDPSAADEFARGNPVPNSELMYQGDGLDTAPKRNSKQVMYYIDIPTKEVYKYLAPTYSYGSGNVFPDSMKPGDAARNLEMIALAFNGKRYNEPTGYELRQAQEEIKALEEASKKQGANRNWATEFPQFVLPASSIAKAKQAKN